jgi:hypothetical protein
VAAAGLAENSRSPADEGAPSPCRLSLTGGLDYASAFYFRGYREGNSGLLLQPYATLFATCPLGDDLLLRPYASFFNSSDLLESDPMRGMSDVMLGASLTWRRWVVDGKYTYYDPPPAPHLPMHELGIKVSYDAFSPQQADGAPGPLALRVFAGVYGELSDQKGAVDLQPGLEPSWRVEVAGRKVGISLPLVCGLSADGYYLNDRGGNAAAGYFSATLTTSVSLPVPDGCGQWFLNASVQYLHLFADNLAVINNGSRDAFVGRVGVGFLF